MSRRGRGAGLFPLPVCPAAVSHSSASDIWLAPEERIDHWALAQRTAAARRTRLLGASPSRVVTDKLPRFVAELLTHLFFF
jgi:hypothetical protein